MRKLILVVCLHPAYVAFAQNVRYGTNQPQTIIDINRKLALRSTSLQTELLNRVSSFHQNYYNHK
jgi:hypothetical protein